MLYKCKGRNVTNFRIDQDIPEYMLKYCIIQFNEYLLIRLILWCYLTSFGSISILIDCQFLFESFISSKEIFILILCKICKLKTHVLQYFAVSITNTTNIPYVKKFMFVYTLSVSLIIIKKSLTQTGLLWLSKCLTCIYSCFPLFEPTSFLSAEEGVVRQP